MRAGTVIRASASVRRVARLQWWLPLTYHSARESAARADRLLALRKTDTFCNGWPAPGYLDGTSTMSLLGILGTILLIIVAAALVLWLRVRFMTSKQKKALVKKTLNGVFTWAEDRGWLPRTPAFDHDYARTYPGMKIFEEHYDDIRAECLKLFGMRDKLVDMSKMGGAYTQAGIHTIDWKTVMFKAGDFVEENCRLCPKTAALLRQTPEVFTAFFSVLEPHQYITPHWGYYKGFVRYHLGVVIPDNNAGQKCWLRVNGNHGGQREAR